MGVLIEPNVLAEAKDFLLPSGGDRGFVVVDSQFKTDTWGHHPVKESVRSRLEPINTLQMADGSPDAILAPPKAETYHGAVEDTVSALPLAVIEAKGETEHPNQNATRVAITQAHGHLPEANIGFAAVPNDKISQNDRALARELNISTSQSRLVRTSAC